MASNMNETSISKPIILHHHISGRGGDSCIHDNVKFQRQFFYTIAYPIYCKFYPRRKKLWVEGGGP